MILVVGILILSLLGSIPGASSINSASAAAARPGITLTGGCAAQGQSFSRTGQLLGTVTVPGSPKASKNHPLLVDPKGTVQYTGSSPGPITSHHWQVKLFNVQVQSGGSSNRRNLTSTAGTKRIHSYIPLAFTGLYYVKGGVAGLGGACAGAMWVKVTGSPIGTVLWYAGLGLLVVGLLVLILARPSRRPGRLRRHSILGVLAGLLIGLAINLMGIIYSFFAISSVTPLIVVIVAFILIGGVLGAFGPTRVLKRKL